MHQNYQLVEVEAELDGRPLAVDRSTLRGTMLTFSGPGYVYRGRVQGDRLRGLLERDGARAPLDFTRSQ